MTNPGYQTVALHEWHLVGPDGLPVRHRTVQVLRGLRPGFSSYTYRFDSRETEAEVHALRGVRLGETRVDDEGLTAVDLELIRPLGVGETASLEYETVFHWKAVPAPELRRAARRRVERLDMRVQFSPERLPVELQWAVWNGYGPDARLRAAELVELDHECSAHRFVDALTNGTIGFAWTWAPGEEPTLAGPAPP